MGKPSKRPNREARKKDWTTRKAAQKELKKRYQEQGLQPPVKPTAQNSKSHLETIEQEQAERQEVVEEKLKACRALLVDLIPKLERIPDPRKPGSVKHKTHVLMLYGILMFILQMSSRRQTNQEMSKPIFLANLQQMFPELTTLPHHDTLNRLLKEIDVDQIETLHADLLKELIRKKKFKNYLLNKRYMIAIDGTQKQSREYAWSEECLHRKKKGENEQHYYYVYVLEATLVFPNGLTLPLLSEFLYNSEYEQTKTKQDCELKAFKRLANRIKSHFPKLSIMVLIDGLYANGPVLAICHRYKWQYMIVLQDKSLPSVWEEAYGLKKLQKGQTLTRSWGNRHQTFWWVNDIEYGYGQYERQKTTVHVVVCEEEWEEVSIKTQKIETKKSKHAWISSEPLNHKNVHERCNLCARYRWCIESNILVEKKQGYQYEHFFSYNWNAMKGYHYLMRMGHLINALAHQTLILIEKVKQIGIRPLTKYITETIRVSILDYDRISKLVLKKQQLRLVS